MTRVTMTLPEARATISRALDEIGHGLCLVSERRNRSVVRVEASSMMRWIWTKEQAVIIAGRLLELPLNAPSLRKIQVLCSFDPHRRRRRAAPDERVRDARAPESDERIRAVEVPR